MEKLRIIVSGFIGSFCISGITWHYGQYPAGLNLLDHDVYYIEDTCGVNYYYNPAYEWGDPTPVVSYLAKTMDFFGLKDRWAYRDEFTGKSFGLSENRIKELCSSADIIISVSNSIYFREEYLKIPIRALIDTDPMFTQIPIDGAKESLSKFTHHFSFGLNVMAEDSKVPTLGFQWRPTLQPICLNYWENSINEIPTASPHKVLTTIMNLSPKNKLIYDNEEWGQKDVELQKIVDLPLQVPEVILEMGVAGVAGGQTNHNWLINKGWNLSNNLTDINNDIHTYKNYIQKSFAEFSVAKETYVKGNTGWFSDRSACYLASGRPAVVQDTKWTRYIPEGKGLLSFTSLETARDAISDLTGNYKAHSIVAKEIAKEYFDSSKVLSKLVDQLYS